MNANRKCWHPTCQFTNRVLRHSDEARAGLWYCRDVVNRYTGGRGDWIGDTEAAVMQWEGADVVIPTPAV